MKRFVNVRIPVILAFAVAAGIGLQYLFRNILWIIAVIPIAAVIFILSVVFIKRKIFSATVVLIAVAILSGAVNCCLRTENFSAEEIPSGEIYSVSATVHEKGETDYGEYIILKNVTADETEIHGKIIAYLGQNYGEFCDAGYKVNFTAALDKLSLSSNYNAHENVRYSCSVYGGLTSEYKFSLFSTIRSAVRNTLYNNLDGNTAAVVFAMLTGNTHGIDEDMLDGFRYGGIAHVFAVSGLHIGIVYGILYFILKKLKINKYVGAALCILPVFFYAGVCGFTLSSVRAAIMCTVASFAKLFNKKYDGLNSLAISAGIIMTVSPFSLFNVGFQLSITAVLGINLLKLPKKLPAAIKIPFAAQAGTAPVMLAGFGYLSAVGLIANIVLIPVISALFTVLFTGTIIATALPFTAFLLPYIVLPLEGLISFFGASGLEKALIYFDAGIWIPFYYAGIFALSDKINLKASTRFIAVCVAVAAVCICVIFT